MATLRRAASFAEHFTFFEQYAYQLGIQSMPAAVGDEVADQDWMELAWLLRHELPDLFIEMLLVLRAKARAHDLGLDEDEVDDGDGKVDLADTDRGRATPVAQDPDEESAI